MDPFRAIFPLFFIVRGRKIKAESDLLFVSFRCEPIFTL